ncbi:MAG: uracil-DNA glycosylase [Deltaproteobacteria bacterium]|nr:uracil-DNA glycosylase [Deltaproteobacteria bacterium]
MRPATAKRAAPGGSGVGNPRCVDCRHYFVTWDPSRRHGCRALGFKSNRVPGVEVMRTSGQPCQYFVMRNRT